ncbi:MAG: 1-acyl-sn-glycerol-3-phosphate acyltransferase [Alphaproteobacteria bacterium]|nr:1-acyl-sn-glycerol-3-phosphate acyltransferase [Alphaproteobacteria bacterium]
MSGGYVKHPNVFDFISAVFRFILFWLLVVGQLPIIILLPRGRISVAYMRVFMWFLVKLAGLKIIIRGQLDKRRPLMVVSNHISIFEIATFPIAFGGSFVAKKELRSWPIVGWIAEKFGVIFVDRRPSHAVEALRDVQECVTHVKYPMFVFPEGTTTNGAYVKPFKSTLFNFVENSNVVVQPIAMHYRFRNGDVISDNDLANHYGYFDNKKIDFGPLATRERSAFMQVFHIMLIGGFRVEITLLPTPSLVGLDRKQIAEILQKQVSDKYMELKDKTEKEITK